MANVSVDVLVKVQIGTHKVELTLDELRKLRDDINVVLNEKKSALDELEKLYPPVIPNRVWPNAPIGPQFPCYPGITYVTGSH